MGFGRKGAFDVRLSILTGAVCALAMTAGGASAQTFLPFTGFAPLPSFAWSEPTLAPGGVKWDGTYARISTGFQVTSSKHYGTFAGPTIGVEAGKMWREGDFVFGIAGALDYVRPLGGYDTPGFGNAVFTRDIAGAFEVKAGWLPVDNVLLYTKVGMVAANETWRFGASPFSSPFKQSDIAVRPEARAGVEWAVTNNLTLGLEVGVVGQAIRP
ncbi:opacity protein-like surface antigen [Bosea sp. BK604]|nr:opacity protein-like surface antigen [Bosea sp. BK604]